MKKMIITILTLGTLLTFSFGECLEGNCENGYGTYYYDGGDIYKGSFKDGLRHGYGTYVFIQDGDSWIGDWKKDQFQGKTIEEQIDDFFLTLDLIDLFFEILSY